ncbi:MAG: branched-chain amino acid ABC transporter permease [Acidimicrobiales bacterium]
MRTWVTHHLRVVVGAVALAVFVVIPFIGLHVAWILPGTLDIVNSTGTLEVLALCFMFAGIAVGYDLMFGFTGLMSLGPVLYFATGVYVFDIALTHWAWPLWPALLLTFGVSLVLAVVLGAIALRVHGIAFAMVTLAFAQAAYYLVESNPHNLTGGDTGLAISYSRLPSFLSGAVSNTRNLYWVALFFLVVAYAIVWLVTESVTGHVFVAIRENERRLTVLGTRPFRFKLMSFVISSLIATGGGIVYILVIGTAVPSVVASTTVTLSILIMVVLGGAGTRWGAVVGAMVYVYLQQYLDKVSAEPSFTTLPAFVRVPLSQPQFLLGAIFVLFVLFAPGGIAGLVLRRRARRGVNALALMTGKNP